MNLRKEEISTPKFACDSGALRSLQALPAIGPALARQLYLLGFRDGRELAGQDPERMYDKMKELLGESLDRCVLYSYRCAVFSANHPEISKKELLWWHFMDSSDSFSK